jgi:hypothetical protein
MSTLRFPPRPFETPVDVRRLALLAGGFVLALALAGLGLAWWPARTAPAPVAWPVGRPLPVYDATGAMLDAIVPSSSSAVFVHPLPVYDATGSMQDAIVPSTSGSGAAAPSLHFTVVDSATASRLAAEHPWTSSEAGDAPSVPAVVVDGATGSLLAAEHPWND